MLMLEEKTPFFKIYSDENRKKLPSDDEVADMYELMQTYLGENGLKQYEVSNFSKDAR